MQMQELWQNGSSGPEKAVRICSFLLLAQVLVPVLSLMDSYTGEVPAWLGKQVTYVWNLKDRKDMEKQEGFCSGGGISRLAGYFGTEGSAKELAERAEAGDERALAVYARCGAVFGRGLAILIDLLNPEKIVAGSVYARSHHLLDKTMYEELEKEALPMNRAACEIVPAALGERIGDYAAVVAAVNSLSIL